MVHSATKIISDAFTQKGIKHKVNDFEKLSSVEAGYSGDHVSNLTIHFISSDELNDVAIRVFNLCKVPEGKRTAVLEAMNDIHLRLRYAKFVMDKEGSVRIEMDIPQTVENLGEVALELCSRIVNIADDTYPELMKVLWS